MNILISHVYSTANKGDAALLSVLISDIRRAFINADITILSIDDIQEGEMFEGVPVKKAFMYYAQHRYKHMIVRALYGMFLTISTLLWAVVYRITKIRLPLPRYLKEIATLYQKADLVIPVGGGYIRSQKGLQNTAGLFFIIHPFIFSAILRKITINYTQSVGPFGNTVQKLLAKTAVKTLDGIIVREQISAQLLKEWGVTKNVFVSVDSGFSFTTDKTKDVRSEFHIPQSQMLVGVTVRSWLPPAQQEQYEREVAKLCDHISTTYDAMILCIPQVTVTYHADDDRESGKRVYQYMQQKQNMIVLTEEYDHHTVKAIYKELDYLVGTRFHSVIFALTAYVPSIAIGYEYKTLGIMTDLGLHQWVLDIQRIHSEQASRLFDSLVLNRDQYIAQLRKVLPDYVARSQQAINVVKELYESK
jgi:colanic acid/amylovoran biosynthesis protein